MFQLLGAPRAPFTDWVAQAERILQRRGYTNVTLDRTCTALKACYDVGISPAEIADTWEDFK